ncbi:hypothetical protein Mboo_1541 [Methanoregula boonei 6A8]|jgi:uncharacterized membrane protein (DUF373 family)|uniref:Phosphate-starvation-inducible E-like protein n=1 Tax=Methanoregula boonei (strain DSM 21154 / JCM 14090 / 6A8) TaxID=456442 RepID=A7I8J7_METB6|nr:phosphate-starvation-inducible PsiE family protein [Methanoregula boonei]ABS56058.1 hypothetical protein Mboo_1541 [Methanoregula boonei 6A8]
MDIIDAVEKFEKVIYAGLMFMLIAVIIVAIVDLGYFLVLSLATGNSAQLEAHELNAVQEVISVLGSFLLILIGVELLDTIKAYFREKEIHVEIVLILAIIAVARSVILLDPTGMSGIEYGIELMGIGVIVVGLGAGYYLIRKAGLVLTASHQR